MVTPPRRTGREDKGGEEEVQTIQIENERT